MSSKEDYINLTPDGNLRWRILSSCMSDIGDALENWKNMLHEVSMRICARITRVVRIVGVEASAPPTYEGLPNLTYFLEEFEKRSHNHKDCPLWTIC